MCPLPQPRAVISGDPLISEWPFTVLGWRLAPRIKCKWRAKTNLWVVRTLPDILSSYWQCPKYFYLSRFCILPTRSFIPWLISTWNSISRSTSLVLLSRTPLHLQGQMVDPGHSRSVLPYCPPSTMESWLCGKKNQREKPHYKMSLSWREKEKDV